MATPNIFSYEDYRLFLRDWVAAKSTSRRPSMRAIAQRAGFKAHNMLPLVLSGKRNLTERSALKVASGIGLATEETQYLVALVKFARSDSDRARLESYRGLTSFPSRHKIRPREKPRLSFFRSWLGPVIFEMVQLPEFRPDPQWIASKLMTRVGVVEVRRVLQDLIESGVISVGNDGKWFSHGTLLATGDGVRDLHFIGYHEQALENASFALDSVPEDRRSFHVLTSAIPVSALADLKVLIAGFEREFWRWCDTVQGPRDEVVQVGLQMFPCLKPNGSARATKEKS